MPKAKPLGYSSLQIGLHWAVALLILIQFVASSGIETAWRAYARGTPGDAEPTSLAYLHIGLGLTIFVLALWRLYLRFTRGAPALPANDPKPLKFLANATHILIYALIVGMPISGSVAWFGGVEAAANAHVLAKNALFILVALHVAAALVQQFVLKTNVLTRMVMTLD